MLLTAFWFDAIVGTFCGVFRRQALDRGAALMGADKLVTGHNADGVAETVLMNSMWTLYEWLTLIYSGLHNTGAVCSSKRWYISSSAMC